MSTELTPEGKPRISFWRKLGGGSLTISLVIHGILLALGIIWIIQIIPAPEEKVVDFKSSGGGGGAPSQPVSQKKQQVNMRNNISRVAAKDVVSNFTLPDPEASSNMSTLGALGAGGLSGGLGGSGSGGGRGDGVGRGFGSGTGLGSGNGKGPSPFGMIDPNVNALVGTFYDLKQTNHRKPTEMTDDQMRQNVAQIVRRGFKDRDLDDYFQASQKLFQTKLYIPTMTAEGAPAAFNCEKEVQPRRWVVVYRGFVQPPKSGKFRFVGLADDLLVVRFNNKPVFDHGYTLASTGMHVNRRFAEINGEKENKDVERDIKQYCPMKFPFKFYKYDETNGHNNNVGGFAIGPEFEAKAGMSYPIDILIGEIPGGFFSVYLMIEEVGAEYKKASSGAPVLPLFRLDRSMPAVQGEAPPIDPEGSSWKVVKGQAKLGI